MLKTSAGLVLASFSASTYPEGTRQRFTGCGLPERPF